MFTRLRLSSHSRRLSFQRTWNSAAIHSLIRRRAPGLWTRLLRRQGNHCRANAAAETLRREGIRVGLLFLVGEERDSLGAKTANQQANGCKFLINGEPTENRVATARKAPCVLN